MYFSILVVMGLIVINATLTYYLFAVLRVSIVAGPTIGSIAMSDNGIVMRGETVAYEPLVAGVIRSKDEHPLRVTSKFDNVSIMQAPVLRLLSPRGISLNSGESKLFLGSEGAVATAEQLVLRDGTGKLQLLLGHSKRLIAARGIRVNNDRALRFNCSIQAPYFTSVPGDGQSSNDLRIESPSRATRLLGPKSVLVKSPEGQVSIHAFRDLKFISKSDKVRVTEN